MLQIRNELFRNDLFRIQICNELFRTRIWNEYSGPGSEMNYSGSGSSLPNYSTLTRSKSNKNILRVKNSAPANPWKLFLRKYDVIDNKFWQLLSIKFNKLSKFLPVTSKNRMISYLLWSRNDCLNTRSGSFLIRIRAPMQQVLNQIGSECTILISGQNPEYDY